MPGASPGPAGHQRPQFQGDWLVLGLAGSAFRKTDRALLTPFLSTFELNAQGHLEVSNAMTRGKRCDTWTYLLIPETPPGHFRVDHRGGRDGEDVQVVEGDYGQFALVVSRRHTGSQTILRISLLGRNWYLPSGAVEKFVCLAKRQGLSKDNVVFPDLTGNGVPGTRGRARSEGGAPRATRGWGRPAAGACSHPEPAWRAPWPPGVGLGLPPAPPCAGASLGLALGSPVPGRRRGPLSSPRA
ncbi:epididymal-specific lipocalin-12 isoform X5 [Oryctolagus cuniculus]|uniref:epididymal-specific lipocalin-12 isoform X5 n=1 Tax=Oryctolagus cuniculus TaxID=9986 RepID=UPI0038794817